MSDWPTPVPDYSLPVDTSFTGELESRQRVLDRLLSAEGAGHVVHDLPVRADGRAVALESRPWRLDPQPYVLTEDDFAWIEQAVAERMRAAEAILDDLYGERTLVAHGIINPAQLWASSHYRLAATAGRRPARWLTSFAVDAVRDVNGQWSAIADLTDAPTGLGYALLDRAVFAQAVGFEGLRPRAIEPILPTLRLALADCSPVEGPRVVVLSGGVDHESYVEHSYLATKLGFNLVEAADLVVRRRSVWLRTLSGLESVDVIHRRLEDHQLDPMEINAAGSAGIPGVLQAAAAGSVSLANAHGSGAIEAGELGAVWDDAAEFLTGCRPVLALRPPGAVLAGLGIDGLLAAPAERVPVLVAGAVFDQPIVLRFHAVAGAEGITVMAGGNGRVLNIADDPRIPTPCVAKDVWVLGSDDVPRVVAPAAPQVDLIASVPTRAAESLFWLGRAAERAEVVARVARVVLAERDLEAGPLEALVGRLVAFVTGPDRTEMPTNVPAAAARASERCVLDVGSMLAESASVREFLSGTAGRVFGAMADVRSRFQAGYRDVDTFDDLLLQLSAFSGLWSESVVRGPAWHFGDLGRRIERAIAVLESLDAVQSVLGSSDAGPPADQNSATMMEILLAGHDSLVAYRRRHRNELEWSQVVTMLVFDERNPRAVAASMDRLRRDAAAIDWQQGVDELTAIERRWTEADDPDRFSDSADALRALALQLTRERLVTPPDPAMVRGVSFRPVPDD